MQVFLAKIKNFSYFTISFVFLAYKLLGNKIAFTLQCQCINVVSAFNLEIAGGEPRRVRSRKRYTECSIIIAFRIKYNIYIGGNLELERDIIIFAIAFIKHS